MGAVVVTSVAQKMCSTEEKADESHSGHQCVVSRSLWGLRAGGMDEEHDLSLAVSRNNHTQLSGLSILFTAKEGNSVQTGIHFKSESFSNWCDGDDLCSSLKTVDNSQYNWDNQWTFPHIKLNWKDRWVAWLSHVVQRQDSFCTQAAADRSSMVLQSTSVVVMATWFGPQATKEFMSATASGVLESEVVGANDPRRRLLYRDEASLLEVPDITAVSGRCAMVPAIVFRQNSVCLRQIASDCQQLCGQETLVFQDSPCLHSALAYCGITKLKGMVTPILAAS
eukprot:1160154-Pelagomonas_calceolata.AAC.2